MSTTVIVQHNYRFGPVQSYDACPPGEDACEHCTAGRPAAPIEAGPPTDPSPSVFEVDDALREALPPAYHRPHFDGLGRPHTWICTACWSDGTQTQWPCTVAVRHGGYVAFAMGASASS